MTSYALHKHPHNQHYVVRDIFLVKSLTYHGFLIINLRISFTPIQDRSTQLFHSVAVTVMVVSD